jgi:O-antigen/teichoic acid export membrane protein
MSNSNTTRLVVRNSIYSALSWVVPFIVGPVVTPILVARLGAQQYGLYLIITGFVAYSFAFGIGKAAAKYVSELGAEESADALSDILSSIFWISIALGVSVLALTFLSAGFVVSGVLSLPEEVQETARTGLYLGSGIMVVTMIAQIPQYVLQGLQRFDRYLVLANAVSVGSSISAVILVWRGYGVIPVLAANLAIIAISILPLFRSVKRDLPDLRLRLRIPVTYWKASVRYSLSIIGYQVFGNALFLFERVWIVRHFGPESLTFYAIPLMLGLSFQGLIANISFVLFPVVNVLLEKPARMAILYRFSMKVIVVAAMFFVVTATVCGRIFLELWMGPQFAIISYRILVAHAITCSMVAVATIAWQIAEAYHAAELNVIVSAIWLMISAPLIIILSERWQGDGVAIARLIGAIVFVPYICWIQRKFLLGNLRGFWLSLFLKVGLTGAVAAVAEWALLTTAGETWFSLGAAVTLGGASLFLLVWKTGVLDDIERKALLSAVVARSV